MNLRTKLIRLAHANPSLRGDLLPLLAPVTKQAGLTQSQQFSTSWLGYFNAAEQDYYYAVCVEVAAALKKQFNVSTSPRPQNLTVDLEGYSGGGGKIAEGVKLTVGINLTASSKEGVKLLVTWTFKDAFNVNKGQMRSPTGRKEITVTASPDKVGPMLVALMDPN